MLRTLIRWATNDLTNFLSSHNRAIASPTNLGKLCFLRTFIIGVFWIWAFVFWVDVFQILNNSTDHSLAFLVFKLLLVDTLRIWIVLSSVHNIRLLFPFCRFLGFPTLQVIVRSILVCRSSTNATLFIDFDTVLICHYIVQVNLLFICSIFNRFVVEVRNTRLDEIGKHGLTRDLFGSTIVIVQILRRNVWLLCWHYVNYFMFVATSHSQSCFIIFHPMCLSFTFLFHTLLLFFMVGKLRGT